MKVNLEEDEKILLQALGRYTKGVNAEKLISDLPGWTDEKVLVNMNSLSSKQYIDFVTTSKNDNILFKLRSQEDMERTSGMGEYERVIYQLVKEAANSGIWIKDLKTRSGLHTKLVNSIIKNLEKRKVIKFVKPVNNPHKKMYLLAELEPSEDLTGGAWYTDNEFDISFIEQLSIQIFRYIAHKTIREKNDTVYYTEKDTWPDAKEILDFITLNNITTSSLSFNDITTLLQRLHLDGKIKKVFRHTYRLPGQEVLKEGIPGTYVYAASSKNYSDAGQPYPFFGIPCKRPSESEVTGDTIISQTILNPVNCSHFARKL